MFLFTGKTYFYNCFTSLVKGGFTFYMLLRDFHNPITFINKYFLPCKNYFIVNAKNKFLTSAGLFDIIHKLSVLDGNPCSKQRFRAKSPKGGAQEWH